MGTASYVLVGTDLAMQEAYGSSCHGAGRASSRKAATKRFRGDQVKKELEAKGEVIRATHMKLLAEEAPGAYKDVDTVIESVHSAGVSAKVARMVPMGVAKG
jgi:tRNA-splicing ligase RtcB